MNFPNKKYEVIYADPPWSYDDKALAGNRGASCKYQTQTKEWIEQLPVKDLAADNCALFVWVTMPKLDEVFPALFQKWGFTYKTCAFTWIKQNRGGDGIFMGMGRWTRANAELCLLGTKGKPKRIDAGVHSVVLSPLRAHSQKPDEVRDRIVRLCGDVPRIELFARTRTPGWDVWGNQIDRDILGDLV